MVEAGAQRRVFFALWPDADTAARIDHAATALVCDGRRIRADKLHMTLIFVGLVATPVVERMIRQADDITLPPFLLRLDCVGYFRRAHIPWLGPSHVPDALSRLAAAVAEVADVDARKGRFRAHVSLARRASPPISGAHVAPVSWHVNSFCLVESGAGGVPGDYRCRQRWPLP